MQFSRIFVERNEIRDPSFSQRRFRELGDVFETKLLAQSIVFIRGERAISDLLKQESASTKPMRILTTYCSEQQFVALHARFRATAERLDGAIFHGNRLLREKVGLGKAI